MTEQIKSIKLDGNNNLVIQSVQNSEIKIETIDWDSFGQKYTVELYERIEEQKNSIKDLRENNDLTKEVHQLKEQKLQQEVAQLQQGIQQKEAQLKNIIQQYENRDLQNTSSLYQRAFDYFITGQLDKALEVLDDAQLDEAEQQQAEARILKANILQLENRFDEAEHQLERAIAIYPSAENLFTFAHFYQLTKAFKKAEKYYSKCLEKTFTENERSVTLNNLAVVYSARNELEKAEQAYQEVLKIRIKLAKTEPESFSSEVASVLNNLGSLYKTQNEPEKAEQAYQKALKIYRKLNRGNSIFLYEIASILNNLGNLYVAKNELTKARQAYSEALKIRRKLAECSPKDYLSDLGMTLSNLGNLLSDEGEYEKAKQAYQEALDIYRNLSKINPSTHLPAVSTVLNNLAGLYCNKNEFEKSELAYEEALDIRQKFAELSPQVYLPNLAETMLNMSIFYCYDYPQKEKSVELAVNVIKVVVQFQHIPTVMSYGSVAVQILQKWNIDVESLFAEGESLQ